LTDTFRKPEQALVYQRLGPRNRQASPEADPGDDQLNLGKVFRQVYRLRSSN